MAQLTALGQVNVLVHRMFQVVEEVEERMAKKKKEAKKKCCNNCRFMAYNQQSGNPDCTHADANFGDHENCKNFKIDYFCDRYNEIEEGKEPADHPVIAMFKDVDAGEEQLNYMEDLNGKEVDIFLRSGAMYTGKVIAYNITSVTFSRTYNGEKMMVPLSEVDSIVEQYAP